MNELELVELHGASEHQSELEDQPSSSQLSTAIDKKAV
jgi:hypothetical protein